MRQASRSARAALILAGALVGALAAPVCAAAATLGSALQVSAEIAPSCRVSLAAPDVGSGTSPDGGPGTGSPAVAVTCTKGVLAVLSQGRPEERPAILPAIGARGSVSAAIDQRAPKSRTPTSHPYSAPLVTTINF